MATATCTHNGTETRLTCVTCEAPICPRCLVETKVGFKCPEHGRVKAAPVTARPAAKATESQGQGKGKDKGKDKAPARRGGMRIWPIIAIVLLFPVVGFGMMALFAATADSTGFVGLLPLLAVGVLLIGGTVYFASKVTR
ncbi:MAG: hypothetical protein ACRD2W_11100 [Acidimicrobiales bacterium]